MTRNDASQDTRVAPPRERIRALRWVRENLFGSWFHGVLTIAASLVIGAMVYGLLRWAITEANWAVIPANLKVLLVGTYPVDQLWRLWTILVLLGFLTGFGGSRRGGLMFRLAVSGAGLSTVLACVPLPIPARFWVLGIGMASWIGLGVGRALRDAGSRWIQRVETASWIALIPVGLVLLNGVGGALPRVEGRTQWGFLLNMLGAIAGIALSLPIGVLLALGRRSRLPAVRWACTAYIELIRGVPLISLLFMASVMLQLLLPDRFRPDLLVRAMVTIIAFSSAYMAENVRGGLQAIPKGQIEAAQALGLGPFLTTGLIVLPQALRAVIPAIVGQFIALFKDTTLFGFIAILEILSMSRSVVGNLEWRGTIFELYVFIGFVFWVLCYSISRVGRRIERRLRAGDLEKETADV